MKVLLSAYACEPGKGSEPGVGWRWASGLASKVELTVLTRASNRSAIEKHRDSLPEEDPLRSVRFVYFDLGPQALRLKKSGLLPTFAYYMLWQRVVARKFGELADGMNVVHHLTFCSLLCPGFWRLSRAVSVIGPLGAPLVPKPYFKLFGKQAFFQLFRDRFLQEFHRLPWLKRVLNQAKVIVPANSETAHLLASNGFRVAEVMLDTGSPEPSENRGLAKDGNVVRFLYAGRLERRKGLELSLRALSLARSGGVANWEFEILGDGPDSLRLLQLAQELGIGNQVRFAGAVERNMVFERMRCADVFYFTSVRDTSGGVNLEAMAMGLPVLCLAHQGVGDITDDTCAIRVLPGDIEITIQRLAEGVKTLCADAGLRENLGAAAKERALRCFQWDQKFECMLRHYTFVMTGRD